MYDTPEKAAAAIRGIHAAGLPLNISAVRISHPALLEAVYGFSPFLGWKQALELAGLNYASIRTRYIDEIPCLICGDRFALLNAHLEKAHQVSAAEYREEFPGADLVAEVLRFRRGGVLSRHPDRIPDWEPALSTEYALDKVHEYHKRGHPINYNNMNQIDSAITVKLIREQERGWDEVMETVGVAPVSHRRNIRESDFTMADFRKWLREREKAGLKNTAETVIGINHDGTAGTKDLRERVVSWALSTYGSWTRALEASGTDTAHPAYNSRNFPDASSILEAIRGIASAGRPTAHLEVLRHPADSLVAFDAPRYFGTWTNALKAAGVKAASEQRRLDLEANVIFGVRKRLENGFPVDVAAMWSGGRRDRLLFKAAFTFFPAWDQAVEAAACGNGILPIIAETPGNPFPDRETVIGEFHRLDRSNALRSERRMPFNHSNICLAAMAHGFFGGWRDAALAAGIAPKSYNDKNLNPTSRYPTEDAVIAGIRSREKVGAPMNARSLTVGKSADQALIWKARRIFGTWDKALESAGFDPARILGKRPLPTPPLTLPKV